MNKKLVSVVVVSYNSEKFIVETLESIKNQNYDFIELIICDDCSVDLTVELCINWITKNNKIFKNIELITSMNNYGISVNINKGLNKATGEWIKFIAGDDYLLNNCIKSFIEHTNQNKNIDVIFSKILVNGKIENKNLEWFYKLSSNEQYREILKGNILSGPAMFIKKKTAMLLGGFDERYPMLEDLPFFLKILSNEIKIYGLDVPLVNYRVHEKNISLGQKINLKYLRSVHLFFKKIYLKELFKNKLYLYLIHYYLEYCIQKLAILKIIEKRTIYYNLLKILSPLLFKMRILKLCEKIKN